MLILQLLDMHLLNHTAHSESAGGQFQRPGGRTNMMFEGKTESSCPVRENEALRGQTASAEADTLGNRTEQRQVEDKFSKVFRTSPYAITITRAADGKFIDVNNAFCTITGYTREEALAESSIGLNLWVNEEDRQQAVSALTAGLTMTGREILFKRRNGEIITGLYSAQVIHLDSEPCILSSIDDITLRKRADEELKFRNLILSTQQEVSIDGILVLNVRGEIVSSNRRFADMWGIPPEIIESKSDERALQSVMDKTADPEEFVRKVKHLYENPDEKSTDEVALKDGRTFDRYSAPMCDAKGIHFGRVWYFRDITESKQTEQARMDLEAQLRASQKMESIGSLAGGVAHDFNNLLSLILSYTQFAMESIPNADPAWTDLLEVKAAGERAAVLTRQLLAFSRKQVMQPVPLNLNQITQDLEKMLCRILGEDIKLVQRLAPNLGLTPADPGQIEQVIMNLAVNARDAMPEGGTLTIETADLDFNPAEATGHGNMKPGPYVQITIADTGCGMDTQTRSRIFEPFYTTKEMGRGTGLGLSTVYGIVKQSNGHICVSSEPGRGTTFEIYLPRVAPDAAAAVINASTISKRSPGTETATVLVVEDEEGLRKVARRTLEAAGYVVLTAADGEDALQISAEHTGDIHLLLTDVVMPHMGGRAVANAILKMRPALEVLYMSGYSGDAIVHHGVLEAGTHFLSKPFASNDLLRIVQKVLDGDIGSFKETHIPTVLPIEDLEVDRPIDKAMLCDVPIDLRKKLLKAVIAARYDEIIALVDIIRIAKPTLAAALEQTANRFDYAALRAVLQE